MPDLTWKQALRWRMRRHSLVERASADQLLETTARICGLHAQVMSSAELTAAARLEGISRPAVEEALWRQRTLVKLWAMRGTLHLLPAAELGAWLGALGTYEHYLKPSWLRAFEITRAELERLIAAVAAALDGALLTREELAREVQRRTRSRVMGERVRGSWGVFLKPASFQGKLCFAPGSGQNVRFTAPSSWLGDGVAPMASEAALRALVRRYLGAFAPAAAADLARWWGVSDARARRLVRALDDEVAELSVDGDPAWMLAADVPAARAAEPARVARLLPGFDAWTVGASRTAPAVLDPAHRARVYRPQGWISPVLLVDGRIDGVWRYQRKGKRLVVEVEPFGRRPRWVRTQVDAEAERLADFMGGALELSWASG